MLFSQQEVFTPLVIAVEKALLSSKVVPKHVGVAVSGGADSMALLCATLLAQQKHAFNLYCLHVEHGIRGEESLADAKLVQHFCKQYDIPLHIHHVQGLNASMHSLEEKARQARHQGMLEFAQCHQLDCILLAHHKGDQAETILMNLCRGTGLLGLMGIKQQTTLYGLTLLRPLLAFSKQELLTPLQLNNIPYAVDSTNEDVHFSRNFMRQAVIPLLETKFPQLTTQLSRLSEQASVDHAFFEQQVAHILVGNACTLEPFCFINTQAFLALHEALAMRVIRQLHQKAQSYAFSHQVGYNTVQVLSFENTKAIFNALHSSKSIKLEVLGNVVISKEYTNIHFYHQAFLKQKLEQLSRFQMPLIEVLKQANSIEGIVIAAQSSQCPNGKNIQSFPLNLCKQATLRFKQKGDSISPFGMRGTQSLKKYFIEKKVDHFFRPFIPLVAVENTVLWACGVGASEQLRTNDTSSILAIQSFMPWM